MVVDMGVDMEAMEEAMEVREMKNKQQLIIA